METVYKIVYNNNVKVYLSDELILKVEVKWNFYSYKKLFYHKDKLVLEIKSRQNLFWFGTKSKILSQDLAKTVFLNTKDNICYDDKEISIIFNNNYLIFLNSNQIAYATSGKLVDMDIELDYVNINSTKSDELILIELIGFVNKLKLLLT